MVPGPIYKIGLTLVLLVATLSSAPLGSMEQAAFDASQTGAQVNSAPASRPSGGSRLERWLAVPDPPPSPGVSRLPDLSLLSGIDPELPAAGIADARAAEASDRRPRPVCERLPYDANAPPSASA